MPKIIAPLTANGIDKLHRAKIEKAVNDGAQPGLVFRVGRAKSTWSLLVMGAQGRKRVTLGSYPDVGLAQARELAVQTRKRVQDATDEGRKSLGELVAAYGAQEGHRLRTWDDQRSGMLWVFRTVVETPCGDLEAAKLQRIVDAHPARVMAARAVGYLRPVLKWGRKRGWVQLVPSDLEKPKGVDKPRGRVLSPDEQVRVLTALLGGTEPHYRIMSLVLLTCCRRDEIAELQWSEVELCEDSVLRLPAERYKTNVDVVIPLVKQAEALFWELLGEVDEGVADGMVFGALHNWSRWQRKLFELTGTEGWHRHDLRRTSATIIGELGYAPHLIDVSLGHKHLGSVVHSIYNKARYVPEHREALQTLADYYTRITK